MSIEVMSQHRVRLPSIRELAVGIPPVEPATVAATTTPGTNVTYTYANHNTLQAPVQNASVSSISPISSPGNSRQGSLSLTNLPTNLVNAARPIQVHATVLSSSHVPITYTIQQQQQSQIIQNHHQHHPAAGVVFQTVQQAPVTYSNQLLPGKSAVSSIQLHPQMVMPGQSSPLNMIPLSIHLQQQQHLHQNSHLQQHPVHMPQPPLIEENRPSSRGSLTPKKKRPRRKANEMVRLYACNYKNCRNSYGTLNHLNAHITFKRHGPKRKPEEFKQIRELYKLKKKLGVVDPGSNPESLKDTDRDLSDKEEDLKLLADLNNKLDKKDLAIFHQQKGYNGYGRYDHTLTSNDLEKIAH